MKDRIATLENRVIDIERTLNMNNQNSRKNNIEVDGIPKEINHHLLEDTVVNIFNSLPEPLQCSKNDFEAVHRMSPRTDTVIVKAKSRKTIEKINKQKKLFKKINYPSIGLHKKTKIYVNDNLCPHMKDLAYNCRILKRENKIIDTWIFGGVLKIKLLSEKVRTIYHELDLFQLFPFFKFSFDTDFCANSEEDGVMGNYAFLILMKNGYMKSSNLQIQIGALI